MFTMPVQKLKEFDALYGWVIRWLLVLILAGIIFFADGRYVTRLEVQEKEEQLHKLRQEDLAAIHKRVDVLAGDYNENSRKSSEILERISGIEAQNAIILRQIERLQNFNDTSNRP